MKKIFIFQTNQPSRLVKIYNDADREDLTVKLDIQVNDDFKGYTYIYITSNEKEQKGDWTIIVNEKSIKLAKGFFWDFGVLYYRIILKTDQTLIADGIKNIDNDLLEWFLKNPTCEELEVEKGYLGMAGFIKSNELISKDKLIYKITIPQEEPKQDWYCPKCKSYVSPESVTFEEIHQVCNTSVITDEPKQDLDVKELNRIDDLEIEEMSNDWETMKQQGKPKQETLEEVAERLTENAYQNDVWEEGRLKRIGYHKGIIDGANYMAKKMYSEEEVNKYVDAVMGGCYLNVKDYFEQIKKK